MKVDQREQAEAKRQAPRGRQPNAAVNRADPAARVAIGQGQVGMAAVRPIEAKRSYRAPVICDGGVAGRYQASSRSRFPTVGNASGGM